MNSSMIFGRIVCSLILSIIGLGGIYAQSIQSRQAANGKYGFVDNKDNTVIPATFDEIHFEFYKGIACVKTGDKYAFIDSTGKILSRGFDNVQYFDINDLCIVAINNNFGIVDLTGKVCLDAKYSYIGDFDEHGYAMINIGGVIDETEEDVVNGGKFGFIDTTGHIIVSPKYSFIGSRSNIGLRWVNIGGSLDKDGLCTGGKFGFIDETLHEVIPPIYTFVGDFDTTGIGWVCLGGKIFTGDKRVEGQISSFSRGEKNPAKIAAKREELENAITGGKIDVAGHKIFGGKYGFINASGKKLTNVIYTQTANRFSDGIAWVSLKGKYGYVDNTGDQIVSCIYEEVAPHFCENIAWAKKNSQYGYITKQGTEVTGFIFSKVNDVKEGFAMVCSPAVIVKGKIIKPAKYGLIDGTGKLITEMKYDGISKIGEGMALGKLNNRYCYINTTGSEITPFIINDGTIFKNGIAVIKINPEDAAACSRGNVLSAPSSTKRNPNGVYGVINKEGIALTDFVYEYISTPSNDRIVVKRNNKFGFIDLSGTEVAAETFDNAHDFEYGYAAVCKDDKWGWINPNGTIVVEPKYEDAGAVVDSLLCVKLNGKWGAVSTKDNIVIPFNLMAADDTKSIITDIYIPNGRVPLSVRQTAIFNAHKKNKETRFSISDIIPNEYWDY